MGAYNEIKMSLLINFQAVMNMRVREGKELPICRLSCVQIKYNREMEIRISRTDINFNFTIQNKYMYQPSTDIRKYILL